ncbi:hypothetical protein MMC18_001024 [Xylographa bjoerkii]|nr:hypothetical protein [Xylographa bjoerkii]
MPRSEEPEGDILGGLVTEQALLISRESEEPHVNALLESTFAIAFMGTPLTGSDLAAWGSVLKGLSRFLKKTSHQIVEVLKPGSEMLAYVQQSFHGMLQQRESRNLSAIRMFCFYEEIGVFGIGKIVEGPSAILPRYSSRGINANHMGMTKFASSQDAGYKAISDRLWIWADEIKESLGKNPVGLDTMRAKRTEKFETIFNSPSPQRI